MDEWILGYDCDGNEIEEFRVLRSIWSNDIDIDELDTDPRQYCAVVADDGKAYAISVYDYDYSDLIRKYENINACEEIPTVIKPISEMVNYEVAICYDNNALYYEHNREKLKMKLNKLLKAKSKVKSIGVKHE